MLPYRFSRTALTDMRGLPRDVQQHIFTKLDYFCSSERPLSFAKQLKNTAMGSYRFRIGDYRVVFDLCEQVIIILCIGHRREIYR